MSFGGRDIVSSQPPLSDSTSFSRGVSVQQKQYYSSRKHLAVLMTLKNLNILDLRIADLYILSSYQATQNTYVMHLINQKLTIFFNINLVW